MVDEKLPSQLQYDTQTMLLDKKLATVKKKHLEDQ
jgi:hypothetical protein